MGYRYPETLVEEFLLQGVTDKNTKILDLACGPGNVAFIVRTFSWEENLLESTLFLSCAMSTVSQILTDLTPVPGFWQQLKKKVKIHPNHILSNGSSSS